METHRTQGMVRRNFLKLAGGAVVANALPQAAQAAAPPTRPPKHLVVIVADTFRADHLGCYGSKRLKTPNLDALAAESVLFENFFADGLPTIPCRRVYHTGRTIIPMRKHGGWIPLKAGRATIAQILRRKGFRTGFIADTYHYFKPGMNFHQGFHSWQWVRGQESDAWRCGPANAVDPKKHMPAHLWNPAYDQRMRQYLLNTLDRKSEADYFCARTLRAGLDWLERNRDARRTMLWLDTFDPHEPWDAPPRFQRLYYDNYPAPRTLFGYGVRHGDIRQDDLPWIRALYAAECSFVDHWVGRFIEGLRDLGLLDDTLLVFTTDHGTHLGEEGCVQKTPALLNSCVARLPLLIRHPDKRFAGKRISQLVSAVDLMPTLLDLMGVDYKGQLDGQSAWPLVTGEKAKLHDHVFTEFGSYAAVRTERWHYFQATRPRGCFQRSFVEKRAQAIKKIARGAPHLYDLEKDPRETTNVALDHLDVVAELQALLRKRIEG